MRQNHASEHHRGPGQIHLGGSRHRGCEHEEVHGQGVGHVQKPLHRLHIPKLLPHPPSDDTSKRRARAHDRGRGKRGKTGSRDGGPSEGGARGSREQPPQPALGRPGAEGRDSEGAYKRPRDIACGRADRSARLENLGPDNGPSERDRERQARHHGDAQPGACGAVFDEDSPPSRRRGRGRHRPLRRRGRDICAEGRD